MATPLTAQLRRKAFIQRTKIAREASGLKQDDIAKILGIPQDRYKNYETRSPLPAEFFELFILGTRADPAWLFAGVGATPRTSNNTEPASTRRGRRSSRAA